MKFAIVIEKSEDARGYGAYVPDLPGCVAVGNTVEEVTRLIEEGVALHIKAMRADGDAIPEPTTVVRELEVA